jgi:hypothetical protein
MCVFLLILTIVGRAALLTLHNGSNIIAINPFLIAVFPTQTITDWLIIEAFDFAFFYISILSTLAFLRLWHFNKPIPGLVGDLLLTACYPFSRLRTILQWGLLLLISIGLIYGVKCCATELIYPLENINLVASDIPPEQLQTINNLLDLSTLPSGLWLLAIALLTLFGVISQMSDCLIMFLLLYIIASIFNLQYIKFFIFEVLEIIRGRLPTFRVGFVNITAVAIFFLFPLLYSILAMTIIFLIKGFSHVV